MGAIPVVVFMVLAMIGLPVALVMIAAGLSGAISIGGIGFIEIIADRFYSGVSGFLLIAIPYFIFTAELMNRAKLTDRLVAFANSLFGKTPGALSHVNVVVSILFAGLTGAAVTDTVAIGKTLIPAMKREGYHADYAAAVTSCSSIIGPIIPPSIIMVVYAATLRNLSLIDLFVAGLIPGLMMGGALLVVSGWISWRRGYASHTDITLKHILITGVRAFPALMIPVIILGGIVSGITTVTEAAGLGAIYALMVGFFGYRTLKFRDIVESLVSTVKFSGVVFFLLGASTILGWYVVRSGIAQSSAEFISMVSTVPIIQIFVVNVLLIIIGMFVDVLPAIVIAAPALAPAMVQLGFDPLHFAVVMLLALNLGNITPPVGMTLMVGSKIAGVTYESAFRQSIPFIIGHLMVLAIASGFPQIILWLPNLVKNIF